MNYLCLQQDQNDCGFACLKMLLSIYYKDKSYLSIVKDYYHEDYSFKEIKDIANNYGLIINGVGIDDLNELYKFKNVIVLLSLEGRNHYSILKKANKKCVYLLDPKLGKIKLTKEEFEELFLRKCLIVESFEKRNILKKKKSIFPRSISVFFFFSYLFDFMLLYLGSFFLKSNSSLLICSLLGVVFFLNISSKIMFYNLYYRNFDNNVVIPLFDKMNGKMLKSNTYTLLVDVKNGYLNNKATLISTVISILFAIALLIMDSLLHLLILFLVLLLKFIMIVSFENKKKILVNNITKIEDSIRKSPLEINKNNYIKMNKYTNKYLMIKLFEKLIVFIVIFFSLNLLMYFTKISSFNFFLFYMLCYLFIDEKITSLVDLSHKNIEFLAKENEFNSLMKYLDE